MLSNLLLLSLATTEGVNFAHGKRAFGSESSQNHCSQWSRSRNGRQCIFLDKGWLRFLGNPVQDGLDAAGW